MFDASNWSNYQTVTLSAEEDPDWTNGSAIIQCSAPGVAGNEVTATEWDNDVINLALASRGSTITGSNGKAEQPDCRRYDSATPLHGWGSTVWTSSPPVSMTLDISVACASFEHEAPAWTDNRYYR